MLALHESATDESPARLTIATGWAAATSFATSPALRTSQVEFDDIRAACAEQPAEVRARESPGAWKGGTRLPWSVYSSMAYDDRRMFPRGPLASAGDPLMMSIR